MKRFSKVAKKVALLSVAATMAFSAAACGGDGGLFGGLFGGDDKIDPNKVQLNIGVYNGGLGYAWLEKVGSKFEEYANANFTFPEGKTGVQVVVTPVDSKRVNETAISNIQTNNETMDVLFTANEYFAYVDADVALDITDVVTAKVYNENGELGGTSSSIYDKMDPYFQEYYSVDKSDGQHFYGVPFEDSIFGLVYDVDLFTDMEYAVPTEMNAFYSLLDQMLVDGVTPFMFNNIDFYWNRLGKAVYAQYEGAESWKQDYFYNGTYNGTQITEANAYLLQGKQGYLEAYKFLDRISNKSYFHSQSFGSASTHTQTQSTFLYSKTSASSGGSQIAMILDGDWWENEAKATFNEMGATNPDNAWGKRNFAMLPMPKINGSTNTKRVVYGSTGGAACFVAKNTDQVELSKMFIQFYVQNSSLATFNIETSSGLPYNYTLSAEEQAQLTPFAKSVYELRRNPEVEIVRDKYMCDFRKYSSAPAPTFVKTIKAFYDDANLDAQTVFNNEHMNKISQSDWTTAYNQYYN